ncbi:hypothetical protein WKR88_09875 [Trinickia caryophylli]|uniref:Uncharacterized protein n=1 Tax=Trinickia caryophylli TaxID=28094 RepID=A0A1X7F8P4_TRICW|nr:hypothetical protein [Trinickia caryophylli]PMS08898.1 hypothetical protein C0Z17_27720 [Trinickia caryophylli]TRX18981.1 hypothetical protein FNF07_12570 [Trinickia caryophylli]WQE10221.1 hypothetical protein U0034_10355 [Trinickia caryophylli]SMF48115.1 hypothetical protein SAMN06295900_10823 [Trinickia caryophylli]
MLQTSEIQKRFSHLQQTISEATNTCHSANSVPQDLMKCVDELDRQCQTAQSAISSQDQSRIQQCIDQMEATGDRAEKACRSASGVDSKVKQCVDSLHSELSEFKHKLH